MVVHADHPGDHGVAAQVVAISVLRHVDGRGGAHGGDPPVAQQHGLVLEDRAAGAVDHAHVFERHGRPLHGDIGAGFLGQPTVVLRDHGVGKHGRDGREGDENSGYLHSFIPPSTDPFPAGPISSDPPVTESPPSPSRSR